MKPNVHLKKILAVDVSNDLPYAKAEICLFNIARLVRRAKERDVRMCGVRKMCGLLHSKDRMVKLLALRHLERICEHVDEIDAHVLHMFYSTDRMINDIVVRYVGVFSRFFKDNDAVFYHVCKSESKYRKMAMQALIEQSCRYRRYEEGLNGDNERMEMIDEVFRNAPEEYFGKCSLRELVMLAVRYPCLVKYFKFSREFLLNELKNRDKYTRSALRKMKDVFGAEDCVSTEWDKFWKIVRLMRDGDFGSAIRMLSEMSKLGISRKFKAMFLMYVRRMMNVMGMHDDKEVVICDEFEMQVYGMKCNGVYRMMNRVFKKGMRRMNATNE